MTTIEVAPVDEDLWRDSNSVHVTCCQNEFKALCGLDMTGARRVSSDTPTSCVVCKDFEEHTSMCPVLGTCPRST